MKIYSVQDTDDGFIFFISEVKNHCYFYIINKFLSDANVDDKNIYDIENMINFIDQKEYEKAAKIAIYWGWLKVKVTSQKINTSNKNIFAKNMKYLKQNLEDAKKIMVFK